MLDEARLHSIFYFEARLHGLEEKNAAGGLGGGLRSTLARLKRKNGGLGGHSPPPPICKHNARTMGFMYFEARFARL